MRTTEILKQAKKAGLCREWQREFKKDHSIKKLCEKYFEGSDWAMQNDFPDLETLRKFKGFTNEHGLHTDFEGELEFENDRGNLAFFGNSVVDLSISGFSVMEIIARHGSRIRLKATGNAFIILNILDGVKVEIEALNEAKVNVYSYHSTAVTKWTGNVSVFQSNFE